MISAIKKFFIFLDLVMNHGISPSTIFKNSKPLNGSFAEELEENKNKHGM